MVALSPLILSAIALAQPTQDPAAVCVGHLIRQDGLKYFDSNGNRQRQLPPSYMFLNMHERLNENDAIFLFKFLNLQSGYPTSIFVPKPPLVSRQGVLVEGISTIDSWQYGVHSGMGVRVPSAQPGIYDFGFKVLNSKSSALKSMPMSRLLNGPLDGWNLTKLITYTGHATKQKAGYRISGSMPFTTSKPFGPSDLITVVVDRDHKVIKSTTLQQTPNGSLYADFDIVGLNPNQLNIEIQERDYSDAHISKVELKRSVEWGSYQLSELEEPEIELFGMVSSSDSSIRFLNSELKEEATMPVQFWDAAPHHRSTGVRTTLFFKHNIARDRMLIEMANIERARPIFYISSAEIAHQVVPGFCGRHHFQDSLYWSVPIPEKFNGRSATVFAFIPSTKFDSIAQFDAKTGSVTESSGWELSVTLPESNPEKKDEATKVPVLLRSPLLGGYVTKRPLQYVDVVCKTNKSEELMFEFEANVFSSASYSIEIQPSRIKSIQVRRYVALEFNFGPIDLPKGIEITPGFLPAIPLSSASSAPRLPSSPRLGE